jgi:hypothetical protein
MYVKIKPITRARVVHTLIRGDRVPVSEIGTNCIVIVGYLIVEVLESKIIVVRVQKDLVGAL